MDDERTLDPLVALRIERRYRKALVTRIAGRGLIIDVTHKSDVEGLGEILACLR